MTAPKPLHIAIDGPVAAGKGVIAALLAKKLNLLYIYTGAMYRALALACLREAVAFKDEERVLSILQKTRIVLQPDKIFLNEEDVTEKIFDQMVAHGSSDVSTLASVRTEMVRLQKQLAEGQRVVMEGRDIGLRVLPDAQLKIYLTATVAERARRRWEQFRKQGIERTLPEVLEDTKKRDFQDTTRSADPLQKVSDAWELDTTEMTEEQVVKAIIAELGRRNLL